MKKSKNKTLNSRDLLEISGGGKDKIFFNIPQQEYVVVAPTSIGTYLVIGRFNTRIAAEDFAAADEICRNHSEDLVNRHIMDGTAKIPPPVL